MLCFTAPEGRAAALAAGAAATAQAAAPSYAPHVPERTLLYALVQAHYPDFLARLEAEDRSLPAYVREEFEEYLRCGVLDHGFLRVVCEHSRAERLVAFSCKKRGFCPSCGARRMAESARPSSALRARKPVDLRLGTLAESMTCEPLGPEKSKTL